LADALLETVDIARSRRAHEALARGDGAQAAAALFVAEQFRYYYRIFSPMGAVGSDLQAYLAFRARDPGGRLPDSLLDAALWRYAQWRRAIDEFIADLGGNWIASGPNVEADIVAQLDIAQRRLPFSDWDDSQLRIALRKARLAGRAQRRAWPRPPPCRPDSVASPLIRVSQDPGADPW
jgi:hypothetical protein